MSQEEWGDFLGIICFSLIGCLLNPVSWLAAAAHPCSWGADDRAGANIRAS